MAAGVACGIGDGSGGGVLEKSPEHVGGDAESSDLVGEPEAEGASAALTEIAVAAEDASGSEGFSLWAAVVETVEATVVDESADDFAVRTGRPFEVLGDGEPLVVAAVEARISGHCGL